MHELIVKNLGEISYESSFSLMQEFAQNSPEDAASEIWFVQHPPVYTLGTACDLSTLIQTDIPTVKTDRGGQITYHGPGQVVMYVMLRLKSFGMGVKALVESLEQAAIDCLADYSLTAERKEGAPGVYIGEKKIAALGLRVKRGWSYHGLSINVDMDLAPFSNIDPCGYKGLEVAQLKDYAGSVSCAEIEQKLKEKFTTILADISKPGE